MFVSPVCYFFLEGVFHIALRNGGYWSCMTFMIPFARGLEEGCQASGETV